MKSSSENTTWKLIIQNQIRAFTLNAKTVHFIAIFCVKWFEATVTIADQSNQQFNCKSIISSISNCLEYQQAATIVAKHLFDFYEKNPLILRTCLNSSVTIYRKYLEMDQAKITPKALDSLLHLLNADDPNHRRSALKLCLNLKIIAELNELMLGSQSVIIVKKSYEVAIKMQS